MIRRRLVALCWAAALPGWGMAETHTVVIEGMTFQPKTLTVQPGDSVVWMNKDFVPHTATAAARFDSGTILIGESWSWTATQPGRFDYVCTYHPGMKATIDVVDRGGDPPDGNVKER